MSTTINKKAFIEALRKLIRKELEEVSTSAATPGYMTPNAFSGKGKMDRRDSVASGSGFEKVNEAKFAVTIDMGQLGQGKVLVDAGSKGAAVTSVAKKLKQGRNGIISVSRVQPALGKQVDKKIESVNEVVKKEVNAVKKVLNNLKKLKQDYSKIMKIGDKTLSRKNFNKYWEAILNAEQEITKLHQTLKGHLVFGINEGRYHDWRNDESMTPKQKIGISVREVRDALNELDKRIKMNLRLKTELNVDSRSYWKNTHKALNKISERLVKLANKVGSMK